MIIKDIQIIIYDEEDNQEIIPFEDLPFDKQTYLGIQKGLQEYQDWTNESKFLKSLTNKTQ
tara:strand:- start:410 stop:592 length:183 start_codon:yes stop_codon:yes gene_type:complete